MKYKTKRTRTDIARGLLKFYALASEIDKRKLTLFGQFCRLPVHSRAKDIFILRLVGSSSAEYSANGYFNDILNVLNKYNLLQHLYKYSESGQFPSKLAWKNLVCKSITHYEETAWYNNVSAVEFLPFSCINPCFTDSCVWRLCRQYPSMLKACKSVIDMLSKLCSFSKERLCSKCGCVFTDEVYHCIIECPYFDVVRHAHASDIMREFGPGICNIMYEYYGYERLGVMLCSPIVDYPSELDMDSFLKLNVVYCDRLWSIFTST